MDELKTESIRRVSEDTSHEINSNGLADSLMLKVKEKINYRQFNRMYTMVVREETPPRTTSNLSSRLKSKSQSICIASTSKRVIMAVSDDKNKLMLASINEGF